MKEKGARVSKLSNIFNSPGWCFFPVTLCVNWIQKLFTFSSHLTSGDLIQDNMISCQASPVDDLDTRIVIVSLGQGYKEPEEEEKCPGEGLEIIVSMDVGLVVFSNSPKDLMSWLEMKYTNTTTCLHSNNSINEENECNEKTDPGESLERLYKSPEQGSDSFLFVQQLHKSSNT